MGSSMSRRSSFSQAGRDSQVNPPPSFSSRGTFAPQTGERSRTSTHPTDRTLGPADSASNVSSARTIRPGDSQMQMVPYERVGELVPVGPSTSRPGGSLSRALTRRTSSAGMTDGGHSHRRRSVVIVDRSERQRRSGGDVHIHLHFDGSRRSRRCSICGERDCDKPRYSCRGTRVG